MLHYFIIDLNDRPNTILYTVFTLSLMQESADYETRHPCSRTELYSLNWSLVRFKTNVQKVAIKPKQNTVYSFSRKHYETMLFYNS